MQDAHATRCMCAKDALTDMYGEKSVLSILVQGGI